VERAAALIAGLLLAAAAQAQEFEKEYAGALAKAAKERRAVLLVFYSKQWRSGRLVETVLKKPPVDRAARACVWVRVNCDEELPDPWPACVQKAWGPSGGIAILTPDASDGEARFEFHIAQQTVDDTAAWIAEAAERLVPPWETQAYLAEWRAKREGKALLVLFGAEKEFLAPFRDGSLAWLQSRAVLLRVAAESKAYPSPGSPGALLYDPFERKVIGSWSGSKKAEAWKGLLERPLAEWAKGDAVERRARWEKANPYVCGFCGYRGAEEEPCCGEGMVKPEPPVFEKTFAAAKARAVAERKVLVYILARDGKDLGRYFEIASEARLAALAGRVVFFAEELADAGTRPKDLGLASGVLLLASRDGKGEPSAQAKLEGRPEGDAVRREVASAVRRLRAAVSK
jgi:hypothetical protein